MPCAYLLHICVYVATMAEEIAQIVNWYEERLRGLQFVPWFLYERRMLQRRRCSEQVVLHVPLQ